MQLPGFDFDRALKATAANIFLDVEEAMDFRPLSDHTSWQFEKLLADPFRSVDQIPHRYRPGTDLEIRKYDGVAVYENGQKLPIMVELMLPKQRDGKEITAAPVRPALTSK